MGENRKQIIELIEIYMDKSLSEGCYIEGFSNNTHTRFTIRMINNNTDYVTAEDLDGLSTMDFKPYWEVDEKGESDDGFIVEKILGHYDITAVLKYISSKGYDYRKLCTCTLIDVIKFNDYIGCLEEKPLHLYTEQEEKDLLELLLKINNGN